MGEEKSFENKIKTFLKEKNCWFVKYWGGGQYTKSGVPDILCCFEGKFLGIEVKAEHGKPSPLQIYNLRQIENAKGYAILLYPNQWEEFRLWMDALEKDEVKPINEGYMKLRERWCVYEAVT